MDSVGWVSDSKYFCYPYQTTTSFCNATGELVSLVSNSISLYAQRALDEKQKELNHSSKPDLEILLLPSYLDKTVTFYHLSHD